MTYDRPVVRMWRPIVRDVEARLHTYDVHRTYVEAYEYVDVEASLHIHIHRTYVEAYEYVDVEAMCHRPRGLKLLVYEALSY